MLSTTPSKKSDLPFDQTDVGTKFVTMVVFLMTILATLAIGGALIIMELRSGWVDALDGQITIEIPAPDAKNNIRDTQTLESLAAKIKTELGVLPAIQNIHVLERGEIKDMIEPWLGDTAGQDDLPLPALIGITVESNERGQTIEKIQAIIKKIDPQTRLETHQTWLSDLRQFSGVLLMSVIAMALAVIASCILTVAGAVKARLAAHDADIDLLHVMGATDLYIAKQFVKTMVTHVGYASFWATISGIILLKTGDIIVGRMETTVLPPFSWDLLAWGCFMALPILVTLLCFVAARITVLRSLEEMP